METTGTGSTEERAIEHLLQFDHWTALLAFATVVVNVVVGSRRLRIAAALLLGSSIAYDVTEFYQ